MLEVDRRGRLDFNTVNGNHKMIRALMLSACLALSSGVASAQDCRAVKTAVGAEITACFGPDLTPAEVAFANALADLQRDSGLRVWFSKTSYRPDLWGDLHVYSEFDFANGSCREEYDFDSAKELAGEASVSLLPTCRQDWR